MTRSPERPLPVTQYNGLLSKGVSPFRWLWFAVVISLFTTSPAYPWGKAMRSSLLTRLREIDSESSMQGKSRSSSSILWENTIRIEIDLGKDLPTFCIKVPTGGGKTLLATQILGLVYQTVLKVRHGSGLILWVRS